MSKRTATTVAKSLGISPEDFLKHAQELGHDLKSATAALDEKVANDLSVKVAMKLAGVPVGTKIIRTPEKSRIKKAPKKKVAKKIAAKKVSKRTVTIKARKEQVPAEEEAVAEEEAAVAVTQEPEPLVETPVEAAVAAAPVEEPPMAEVPAEIPAPPAEEIPAGIEPQVEEEPPVEEKPRTRTDGLGPHGEAVVIKWPDKPQPKKAAAAPVAKEYLESLAAELASGSSAAAPAKKGVKKKVIKKIIRKVVRRRPSWPSRPTGAVAEPPKAAEPPKKREPVITQVTIDKVPTVSTLARLLHRSLDALRSVLDDLGADSHPDAEVDEDAIIIVGQELGVQIELALPEPEPEHLEPRPPVVTVMGHVDHGKTSILDAIRNTQVVAGESGGITQHIGASKVLFNGQVITFIDTPGHEAFTAMRQRGANTTDLVVLVVAADDGVMPQTVEAINHANNAKVPILVAVNKSDLPAANPDKVKRELAERGLSPEDWGGQTIICHVSAITKEGIDHLLEMILLQAEMLELKANPKRRAEGIVIESKLDAGRGPVASVIVRKGTLRTGDYVVSDDCYGKVRALTDDRGQALHDAGPSIPVEVLGLNGAPAAGSAFRVLKNEKQARRAAEAASGAKPSAPAAPLRPTTIEELFGMQAAAEKKDLKVIIKADVQGSVEALVKNLSGLSTDKVNLSVVHSNVGEVNVSDVMLAAASGASIIAFRVRADVAATEAAKRDGVPVFFYEVIYKAIESIRQSMENLLDPEIREVEVGLVEVRQVFESSSFGMIAGCYVRDGVVQRNAKAKLFRNDEQLWGGGIASLRRFKDEVREVQAGYECGIRLEGWGDIEVGDMIRVFAYEKIAQTL
ncbi:MAG: translation initiation factor IF-2 [Verrucomicrobia bacterium]|nr:translation initiation factor IF-2 [Verrucomicrobiota bacterium]